MDSDARLSRKEFRDGITPIENFTKGSLAALTQSIEAAKVKREKKSELQPYRASKMSNTLHGIGTQNEREHLKNQTKYA